MMTFTPIGFISTPFTTLNDMPIQPAGAIGKKGTIELFEEYRVGLKDLDGFSHIILLYQFHRSSHYELLVVPFMDTQQRGVFATRAPRRPNPIGLSIVQLEHVNSDKGVLHVRHVDMLNGTPLLDIKPYVPMVDAHTDARIGWLEHFHNNFAAHTSDTRFIESANDDV